MSATLVVRHKVDDYAAWRKVYDELEPLRVRHGCTGQRAWQLDGNPNDVLITHDFPTAEDAGKFSGDPDLQAGMARAGVAGPPQVEIFTVA
jgi:hypothetical protein